MQRQRGGTTREQGQDLGADRGTGRALRPDRWADRRFSRGGDRAGHRPGFQISPGLGFRPERHRNHPRGPFAFLIAWILAPIAAALIQMAVSRSREYQADESGAYLSHDPEALASALRKIELAARQVPVPPSVSPAQAHMFIINPFKGRSAGASSFARLFSTHPPTEARIARLEQIAQKL